MSETEQELGLQDEDRLPWLEAVENDDEDEDGLSSGKMMGFLIAAVLALGVIVGGVWWLRSQQQTPQGDGTLIAAEQGDYKVKPDSPGGMKVEGQGDATFAASEGAEANGKVDTAAQPETPVAGQKASVTAAPKPVPAKAVVKAEVPPSGGTLKAPAVATAGGGWVQLGAYGSEATANSAWKTLAAKNPSLAKLPKTVVAAKVGGATFYRLRANAGSPASATELCGQVSNCMVVR